MEPVEWQIIAGVVSGAFGALLSGWFVSSLRLGERGESAGGVLTGLGAGFAFGLHGAGVPSPEPSSWFGVAILIVAVSVLMLTVRRLEALAAEILGELPVREGLDHLVPGHGAALARRVGPGIQLTLRLSVGLAILSWLATLYLPVYGVLDEVGTLVTTLLTAGLAGLIAALALWRWRQLQEEGGSAWDILPWVVVGSALLVSGPFLLVLAVLGGLGLWSFGGPGARSQLSMLPVMLHLGGGGDATVRVDGQTWQVAGVRSEGTRVDRGAGFELVANDTLWGLLSEAKTVEVDRGPVAVLPGRVEDQEEG